MPDGVLVRGVPEGVTKSQIMAKYGKYKAPTDPSLMQRIGSDFEARQANEAMINQAQQSGEQGVISSGLQRLGQGAGMANDVVGQIGKSIYNSLPEEITQPINQHVSATMEQAGRLGNMLPDVTPEIDYRFDPVTKRNIEAVMNMAGAVPTVAGSMLAGKGAVKGAQAAGKAAKNSAVGQGIVARGAEELIDATDIKRASSSAKYQAAKAGGAVYTPQVSQDILSRVDRAVGSGKLNSTRHADTISAVKDFQDDVAKVGTISLEELDLHRQNFSEVINDNTDAVTGRMNSDAHRAMMARNALDDAIEHFQQQNHLTSGDIKAVELLKEGRAEWAKAAKFEKVSNLVISAKGDPAKIKSNFQRFVNNRKNLKGFTAEEQAVLRAAANNTITEKILKGLGRFGIAPENVYLPMMGAGIGHLAGSGGAAGGLIAAGTVARQTGKWTARGKAEKALKVIEK